MSVAATTGVAALGRILRCVGSEPPMTVADLSRRCGVARSTAFDIVNRLEAAGLVERAADGHVIPGKAAIFLAFARYGLPGLHGPAEAILIWLRDETDASASLVHIRGPQETVLLSVEADGRKSGLGGVLSEWVADAAGVATVQLRLAIRPGASRPDKARAALYLRRAADTLASHVRGETTP